MSIRSRKNVLAASAVGGLLAVGATVAASSSAQAIPYYEKSCIAYNLQSNTAVNGWRPVNYSSVTVYNGTVGRWVVVNFNADAGVDTAAEIRLGYRVDLGGIQTPGAQNFANHTEYWETRHSMSVLWVPAGTHTIRPYWRISGAVGKNGYIYSRCLTAEARTS